jgi:hypothetical protein
MFCVAVMLCVTIRVDAVSRQAPLHLSAVRCQISERLKRVTHFAIKVKCAFHPRTGVEGPEGE